MIIHQPEIVHRAGEVVVSSRIEISRPLAHIPTRLWFSFPEHHCPPLTTRADAFAASLLIMAMHLGEQMQVRGHISPQLVAGMEAFQRIYASWFPKFFQTVALDCPNRSPAPASPTKNATAFSGGLDSFFTLWDNLPSNQPDPVKQVSAGIFIHGFDQRLDDLENRRLAVAAFTGVFQELGLEFYSIDTNIYQFSEFRLPWPLAYFSPLAGTLLNFSSLFSTIYLPTADEYFSFPASGRPPEIDRLLSTESLVPVAHGYRVNRRDKLEALLQWPPAQKNIRVCYDKVRMRGVQNCSRCDKCLTLMTDLELFGMLPQFSTFDGDLSWRRIIHWGIAAPIYLPNQRALRAKARRLRRWDIYLKLCLRLVLGLLRQSLFAFAYTLLPQPIIYRLKRLLLVPDRDPPPNPEDQPAA